MTAVNPTDYYHQLKELQRNVDALSYLASLIPEEDDISPLIRSLSDSLSGAMVPVMFGGITFIASAGGL